MLDVRPSPIAGFWYPGDPEALARSIDSQLSSVEVRAPAGEIVGLIAPHAGHRYSGRVAAHAFRLVKGRSYDLVAIVSPMHHAMPGQVLTTAHGAYATPLGAVEVDRQALDLFSESLGASGVAVERVTEDPEHSLEIEIPFLQRSLEGGFRLLPVMLRDQSRLVAEAVGRGLASVLENRRALLVASSDLSHFYPDHAARQLDSEMLARIQAFSPEAVLAGEEQGVAFACGKGAVAAVLWAADGLGADRVDILNYAHSGDVTGDDDSVVGYGAAVIYRAGIP
ncbi:MAG TPA: AmmeMemoRadiSam system protein B [Anaerolineales bacterium]|nr:AmmeMemoRadiSam system protein B [Anaerolineales bacterium]